MYYMSLKLDPPGHPASAFFFFFFFFPAFQHVDLMCDHFDSYEIFASSFPNVTILVNQLLT